MDSSPPQNGHNDGSNFSRFNPNVSTLLAFDANDFGETDVDQLVDEMEQIKESSRIELGLAVTKVMDRYYDKMGQLIERLIVPKRTTTNGSQPTASSNLSSTRPNNTNARPITVVNARPKRGPQIKEELDSNFTQPLFSSLANTLFDHHVSQKTKQMSQIYKNGQPPQTSKATAAQSSVPSRANLVDTRGLPPPRIVNKKVIMANQQPNGRQSGPDQSMSHNDNDENMYDDGHESYDEEIDDEEDDTPGDENGTNNDHFPYQEPIESLFDEEETPLSEEMRRQMLMQIDSTSVLKSKQQTQRKEPSNNAIQPKTTTPSNDRRQSTEAAAEHEHHDVDSNQESNSEENEQKPQIPQRERVLELIECTCEGCNSLFHGRNREQYTTHLKRKHGVNPFKCPDPNCNEEFETS